MRSFIRRIAIPLSGLAEFKQWVILRLGVVIQKNERTRYVRRQPKCDTLQPSTHTISFQEMIVAVNAQNIEILERVGRPHVSSAFGF